MEPAKPDLIEVGRSIREAFDAEDNAVEALRGGRARLLEKIATRGMARSLRSASSLRRTLFASVAALSAVAAVVVWMRLPVSFRVGSSPGRVGDVIEANGESPLGVQFSEGSSILAEKGARLRVLAAESAGARVLLEDGPLDVAIVHQRRHATRWRFEAGPLAVLVTGTKFRLDWNAKSQSFALDMREGIGRGLRRLPAEGAHGPGRRQPAPRLRADPRRAGAGGGAGGGGGGPGASSGRHRPPGGGGGARGGLAGAGLRGAVRGRFAGGRAGGLRAGLPDGG